MSHREIDGCGAQQLGHKQFRTGRRAWGVSAVPCQYPPPSLTWFPHIYL